MKGRGRKASSRALRRLLFVFLMTFALGHAGCSGVPLLGGLIPPNPLRELEGTDQSPARREAINALPAPDIPEELRKPGGSGSLAQSTADPERPGPVLPYVLQITCPDDEVRETLESVSLLERLLTDPPEDILGLERRLVRDKAEGVQVLQSYGYYAGTVMGEIDATRNPVVVRLLADPGPRYRLAGMKIRYTDDTLDWDEAPRSLADVGLRPGQEARADAVLQAVDAVSDALRDNGYPFATLISERYIVDHHTRTLDADIYFEPGEYATMGRVRASGSETVDPSYFERQRTWDLDEPWHESAIAAYQEHLAAQGLFRSITITPSEEPVAGVRRDVIVVVEDAPQRTVSGGIRYDTDRGPGVQAAWENRNLTGGGQRLRLEGEYWKDLQVLRGSFRIPAFPRRDMDFIADAWIRHELTDAYELTAAWAGAGFERRFWDIWSASIRGTVEGGTLRTNRVPRNDYFMVGLPMAVKRDSTNSLLDPVRGTRTTFTLSPYQGRYDGDFTAAVMRFDGSAYYDVWDDERLVIAGRVAAGTVLKDGSDLPATLMFYSGGGGSVRGYAYQSLGPRDEEDNPLGGYSMVETSLEFRIRVSETIGVVPFIDGGNVFNSDYPDDVSMRWAAGLGLRYYTSIGPVRLDAAVPLNKRRDDAAWQVYISIGQSF